MENKSYSTTIEVDQPEMEVFNAINNVTSWWSKDFKGSSKKLKDEFIINHPGQHFSKQQVTESIPGKKITWLVTESKLHWLKSNQQEWTNTKMIFEISSKAGKTILQFTHEGLDQGKESYAMCKKGWDMIIHDWLFHLITTGNASDGMSKAAEIRNQLLDKLNAGKKDYHKTIIVNASPRDTAQKISQIHLWWKNDFVGTAEKLDDKFTIPFSESSFVDFVISEYISNKKIVWKVTDCYLPWFQNKKEWNDTEVVFELSGENKKTTIDFTHIGLVPEVECYAICEKGWNGHIDNLARLINEGVGIIQLE